MKSHYRGHKMAVWLNLIPQLHRPGEPEVSMRHHHFHEREPHYYSGKCFRVYSRCHDVCVCDPGGGFSRRCVSVPIACAPPYKVSHSSYNATDEHVAIALCTLMPSIYLSRASIISVFLSIIITNRQCNRWLMILRTSQQGLRTN